MGPCSRSPLAAWGATALSPKGVRARSRRGPRRARPASIPAERHPPERSGSNRCRSRFSGPARAAGPHERAPRRAPAPPRAAPPPNDLSECARSRPRGPKPPRSPRRCGEFVRSRREPSAGVPAPLHRTGHLSESGKSRAPAPRPPFCRLDCGPPAHARSGRPPPPRSMAAGICPNTAEVARGRRGAVRPAPPLAPAAANAAAAKPRSPCSARSTPAR